MRWQLNDLRRDWEIPKRVLIHPAWQTKVARRLGQTQTDVRVQIARDMIGRIRELTRTISQLYEQLAGLVRQVAPQLLAERGLGVLIAAKLIGEITAIDRFTSDAQLARISRMRPDPRLIRTHRPPPPPSRRQPPTQPRLPDARLTKIIHDPRTAIYIARHRKNGKTSTEAIRSLKRHLVRRVYHLLHNPDRAPTTICLT